MMSRRAALWVAVGALLATTVTGSVATATDEDRGGRHDDVLQVRLTGYQEDPLVLSTTGVAQFRAVINDRAQEINYRLTYRNIEGTITQSHIHFGGSKQSGGIVVFLCTNAGNGPVGTQACPPAPNEISGTIRPADLIGPAGQGIAAGEFSEFVAAIRAGMTYANLHSSKYPAGEVRGQLDHNH